MGKIKLLSDSMIGKIAAGEVVERPVSAVKELVENSLDAGASAVTVEIREGGLAYLRVTDNGCGIDESDLRLAFERHATSKISKEPDLYSIATLGFRGEALASIAAVSHIVMTTRTAQRDTGLKVTNEGGRIMKIEEAACTTGTTIVVTDLFFNTPVRKGFMKKPSAEASAIQELMHQFVLSRPDVSFRYLSDGKTVLHSPGDGQLTSAAMTVFGSKAMRSMRAVEGHAAGIMVKGFVGIGESARGNRGQEYFFINRRMMHSAVLSNAVETACRERVMIGKFPVCALHIKIAYEAVDVNVHPNKLEVRFRDETAVSDALLSIVLEALKDSDAFEKPVEMVLTPRKNEPVPDRPSGGEIRNALKKQGPVVTVTDRIPDIPAVPAAPSAAVPAVQEAPAVLRETTPGLKPFTRPEPAPVKQETVPPPETPPVRKEEKAEQVNTILPDLPRQMKIFGALFNTFILVEYEDRLLMVDQHAVHERLLFDRLMRENSGQHAGQELLVPIVISVSPKEELLIDENRELFESIGLAVEKFGEHEMIVRTIPMVLGEAETASFVREILSEIERSHTVTFESRRAAILQAACKHAVKGGESLTEDQLRSILDEMLDRHVTPTCPHGRPLVISISHREIDKKFKRIQD